MCLSSKASGDGAENVVSEEEISWDVLGREEYNRESAREERKACVLNPKVDGDDRILDDDKRNGRYECRMMKKMFAKCQGRIGSAGQFPEATNSL
jgi:hypothetical protein